MDSFPRPNNKTMPFVIGLSHETTPVEIREKLAIEAEHLPERLLRLKSQAPLEEIVLLSTCNRTEVYASSPEKAAAAEAVGRELHAWAAPALLTEHLYVREDQTAVQHLFRVASGLDSMVKGEHEILSQVKRAYQIAHASGFTGKLLNVLFQRSLYVGKRVRTETGLSLGASSVGSVAVTMAARIFSDLTERTVMILGAGQMAERTAQHLLTQKVRTLLVANRTLARAQELAAQIGGQALSFEAGLAALAQADIVICSTASSEPIIRPDVVQAAMAERRGRSLFFIDIAMPRDVDPAVHRLDNVYLYNIDDLQKIVNDRERQRVRELAEAEAIVQQETSEFVRWLAAHHLGQPLGLRHGRTPS